MNSGIFVRADKNTISDRNSSKNTICQLCLSGFSSPLYKVNSYQIRRCDECSFVFCERPENFNATLIYNTDYFTGGCNDGYFNYGKSEKILRKEFRSLVIDLVKKKSSGHLIEIGPAYGFFLQEGVHYFSVKGFEVSREASQICQNKGLDVTNGDFLDASVDKESADIVVMFDTVEHLENPRKTLTKVYEVLKPGGLLLLTTGDIDSLMARLMRRHWRLMTPPQHLSFFSKTTIKKLLFLTKFKRVKLYYRWKFVPLSLVMFQLSRWLPFRFYIPRIFDSVSVPMNLFDSMTVMAHKDIDASSV